MSRSQSRSWRGGPRWTRLEGPGRRGPLAARREYPSHESMPILKWSLRIVSSTVAYGIQNIWSFRRRAPSCISMSHSRSLASAQIRKTTVLFCGKEFPHTMEFARDALPHEYDIFSVYRSEIYDAISQYSVDVLVPLMCRIDRRIIDWGARNNLKLIHQFGTGLEGVDREAAANANIPVLNIPASDCGNASSCAEHVFWMLLTLKRCV